MNIKKIIPLLLLLGLLTAALMWFVSRGRFVGPQSGWGMPAPMEDSMIREMDSVESTMPAYNGVGRMGKMTDSYMPGPGPIWYPGDDALDTSNRAVQKFASHSLVVGNVSDYMRQMRDYISSIDGVVLSYNQGSHDWYNYGYLNAKVPVARFDEAISKVTENVGKVVSESVSAQDITGQVVSVEDRLQDLQDRRAELEIQLSEAETDAEEQRIQLQIDQLDRQIEQQEQQQQANQEQTEYATLNISVADSQYYYDGSGPRPLGEIFRNAWRSLSDTGFGILAFLIWVIVYGIIWIPVLILARWLWGKVKSSPKSNSK